MKQSDYYQEQYWDKERIEKPFLTAPNKKAHIELIQLLKQHTAQKKLVLDVGCGDGHAYTHAINQLAKLYVGADISLTALRRARKNDINVVQLNTDYRLPFPEQAFDMIICIDVLEHLFNPEGLVRNIRLILKPNGTFIATVPNIAHFPHRLRMLGGKFVAGGLAATANTPWRDPHIRFFTLKSLKNMIEETGFQKINIIGNNAAFLVRFPVLSIILRKTVGNDRLARISDIFEPLGKIWPTIFAGRLIAVAQN